MRVGFGIDVRDVCPTITTPTLIIHRVGDRVCHVENARYLARTIPTAKYVELQGADHVEWGSPAYAAEIVDEIREFLTGTREPAEPERALVTVLFTDIVGSTEQAVAVGDAQWAAIVERHHDAVRAELQRFRGREIDTAGDGFFASFDGPARAIRCADAIRTAVAAIGLDIRAGVHTGECEIVGDSLRGIAVHTGARVAAQATAGEILVSSTVRDLVAGSGIEFTDRGFVALKGLPEQRQLFAVSRVAD
jgi:class 3 adenylate cyclase